MSNEGDGIKTSEKTLPACAEVIVASTGVAEGKREDRSGAVAVEWLRKHGFKTPDAIVVSDSDIPNYLGQRLREGADLPRVLLTTGGTGIASDDCTVETVRPHLDKELPGIMAEFFRLGTSKTPTAVLSGGVAGIVARTFVMTLPGSASAVEDGLTVLDPIVKHIVEMLDGHTKHA